MQNLEDLVTFLNSASLERVAVVSFKNIPPQYVRIVNSRGESRDLVNEIVSVSDRAEEGRIKVTPQPVSWDSTVAQIEDFDVSRIRSLDYLGVRHSEAISGIRVNTVAGPIIITCGDAPYSLFFAYGDVSRGRPEFPLVQYETKVTVDL